MTNELKPCPFCGSKQTIEEIAQDGIPGYMLQHMCCMIRPSWWTIKEEAIKAWNTRACDECERGAIPATEENMREHGWVRERTCQQIDTTEKYQPYVTHSTVCSLCGEMLALEEFPAPNYCPSCGAKVVDQ